MLSSSLVLGEGSGGCRASVKAAASHGGYGITVPPHFTLRMKEEQWHHCTSSFYPSYEEHFYKSLLFLIVKSPFWVAKSLSDRVSLRAMFIISRHIPHPGSGSAVSCACSTRIVKVIL